MRILLALLVIVAPACFAQSLLKNAGARLGPVTSLDCAADGGLTCARTATTGTGRLYCSAASATETGCVTTGTQTFSGVKDFKALSDGGVALSVYSDGIYTERIYDLVGGPLDLVGTGLDPVTAVRIASYENTSGLSSRLLSVGRNYKATFEEKAFIDPQGTIQSDSYVSGTLGLATGAAGNGTALAAFPTCDATSDGRLLFDATSGRLHLCTRTLWQPVALSYADAQTVHVPANIGVGAAANSWTFASWNNGASNAGAVLVDFAVVLTAGVGAGNAVYGVYNATTATETTAVVTVPCASAAGTKVAGASDGSLTLPAELQLRLKTSACGTLPIVNISVRTLPL